jgi:hypothetical protein
MKVELKFCKRGALYKFTCRFDSLRKILSPFHVSSLEISFYLYVKNLECILKKTMPLKLIFELEKFQKIYSKVFFVMAKMKFLKGEEKLEGERIFLLQHHQSTSGPVTRTILLGPYIG